MNWNKYLALTVGFLFFLVSVNAQQENSGKPLAEILKSLETEFNVSFTYADKNIEDIYLTLPQGLTLNQCIKYLNSNIDLEFRILDGRYITITKKTPALKRICGYLVDRDSREPVYASILVRSDTAITNLFNTNDQGYFDFSVTQGSKLVIESLGYKPISIQDSRFESCITLAMEAKLLEIDEVIVLDYITSGINKLNNGSFAIRSQDQGILPGLIDQDVLLTIQALPGIQSVNERVADINVRGGTNDQNLILWDGIRMYQSGHFFGLISAFNPYLTQRVNLIKNGSPARYTNGISSTIDIRSDEKLNHEFSGGIGLNLINADINLNIPLGNKASIQVSGRRSISDLIQTPTYQQYFDRVFSNTEVTNVLDDGTTTVDTDNERFLFRDFSFRLLYEPSPKDKFSINLLQIENNISFEENADINGTLESRTSSLDQDNLSMGISYTRQFNERLKMKGFTYYSSYNLRAVNFDVINDQRLIQENEVIDTGIELDLVYSLNKSLVLNTGYQFYEIGVGNLEDLNNPVFRRYIKKVMRTHVGYGELEYYSKSGTFFASGGVRANYYNKLDEFVFEPRLSINQKFSGNFSIGLLGEMKSQTTTQVIDLQNDFLGVEKRRWILTDGEDIPLMENKQISLILDYINNGLLVSVDTYFKRVDGITSQSQGFQNQFQFARSIGGYDSKGIDFLINYKYKWLSTWGTYSLAENIYDFPEFTPSEFPSNLDIQHSFGLGASVSLKRYEFSSGFRWHTGIPYTIPVEGNEIIDGNINYGPPNEVNLSNYARLDVSLKYTLPLDKGKSMEFGASIWNLLDRENVISNYFIVNSDNELESIEQSSLGITPNFMIRFNFN